ncbi:MAG: DUF2782 domain-containing protein [Rhodocyclaceae bacterium]|nr:DUF2782 domain-containing protein [Rhodocyclaceae bacterium]
MVSARSDGWRFRARPQCGTQCGTGSGRGRACYYPWRFGPSQAMTPTRFLTVFLAVCLLPCSAWAAAARNPAAPTPPGLIEVPDDDGAVPLISPASGPDEPEIRIRTDGDTTYEEYRRDGRVYMVRVKPRLGPPYYLIDNTGDGRFMRHDGPLPMNAPAQWRIYQF